MKSENQEHGSDFLTSIIVARHLSKSFSNGGVRINVLKEINLELPRAETVAIVGASGIGKSTLLHILGTLDRPDSGKLLFKGENVLQYDDVKLARFRNESVGFVFQFHHLLPEFSAIENTMMPARIQGVNKQKAARVAEEILVRVGLKDRLNYLVGKLSGGEQQRVALARALVLKPAVLLADEPTGNLDTRTGYKVFQLLQEMSAEYSLSAVMVTHNLALANEMNRCLTLADGKLQE